MRRLAGSAILLWLVIGVDHPGSVDRASRFQAPGPRWEGTRTPTLNQARVDVGAESVWAQLDAQGIPLSGRGVVYGVIDDGIDLTHPMFFHDDAGSFDWIDTNGDGQWNPGDAVDLDGDSVADPGESLGWIRSTGIDLPDVDSTRFQPRYDFLYQDADGNGRRDFGHPAFPESQPSYGERLFRAPDENGNGALDPGERLRGLGTSKVRAVRSWFDDRVFRRGVDLIELTHDYGYPVEFFSHSTLICGPVNAGWRGHPLAGVAPEAEMVMHWGFGDGDLEWVRDEGADVVFMAIGGGFSHGDSELETRINALVSTGVIVALPAGNSRLAQQHVAIPVDGQGLWDNEDIPYRHFDFIFDEGFPEVMRWTTPWGETQDIDIESRHGDVEFPDWEISFIDGVVVVRGWDRSFFVVISATATDRSLAGRWVVSFPGFGHTTHAFTGGSGSWVGGDHKYTVTWPGTASGAVTVGAYDNFGDRDISFFSGEGPRIDGAQAVDIAAPGLGLITTAGLAGGSGFVTTGGTSVSTPFVAGAAVLLKQAFPDLTPDQFRSYVTTGARTDRFTGDVDRWGAGRLSIQGALAAALQDRGRPETLDALPVAAFPNPSREAVRLSWSTSSTVSTEVRVFSAAGRLVREGSIPSATREFVWDGRTSTGLHAVPGTYFAHIRQGNRVGVVRLTRLP